MYNTVLRCGQLTVRSSKASVRANDAEKNSLSINNASYSFTGLNSKELLLNNKSVELHALEDDNSYTTKEDCQALFFDQTHYMFSITIKNAEKAYVFSPLAAWCDSSDWDPDSEKLSIPVNFKNDLGNFELCWEWVTSDGELHRASFSGQVFSTKLDIYKHFEIMLKEVKDRFKWIQLDLLRQTTWGWSTDSDSESNLKTWLMIFQEVRETMEELLWKLVKQHRRRLVSETRMLRAEQMRKISPKLEEQVAEGILDNPNRHYPVGKKVLDADTPENRYIKHILLQTFIQLNKVIDIIKPVDRIADIFKERLSEWSDSLGILKQHRFWRGISEFNGLRRESLILSQDPLYAGIRRSWYLLQQGLVFLNKDLHGGIQNAAQLYEIWCLVKIDQIINKIGWQCIDDRTIDFETSGDNFDIDNEKQIGATKFTYEKDDLNNVELSLLFQPYAGKAPSPKVKNIWNGMMASPVPQNPDIVLRLHRNDLPGKPVYTWIFDAKYRINENNAPDEAINQMHRYRDAILWAEDTSGTEHLIRESIGAYVLYPGDENNLNTLSPQIASIDKTNIGAFPLRPDPDNKDSLPEELTKRIKTFLDIKKDYYSIQEKEKQYFKAVPEVRQKADDIFAKCIINFPNDINKDEYRERCRYFHISVTSKKRIEYGIFPILSLNKMKLILIKELYDNVYKFDKKFKIYNIKGSEEDKYWLFELGAPLLGKLSDNKGKINQIILDRENEKIMNQL